MLIMFTHVFLGPAVYFHLDESVQQYEDCSSAEENGSGVGENCQPVLASPDSPIQPVRKKHWWLNVLYSVAKYVFFGIFVLGLNKLHRFHKRKRLSSGSQTNAVSDSVVPVVTRVYKCFKNTYFVLV